MIVKRLESAIVDIDALIALTKSDIEDIKEAQHDKLSKRLSEKEALINSFEQKKALLNSELLKLTQLNEGKSMDQILDDEATEALTLFKDRLSNLKAVNKEYAKFVATISEFYNSLIDKMFTLEGNGYQKTTLAPATIFMVSA
jgi:predicted nuclease with TOPRIM domain